MTTQPRYTLYLLASACFVSGMSMRMAEPLLPKVAAEFSADLTQASILLTSFTLAYGLFQLVHGPLGDRIGKLRTMAGALALASLASLACMSAQSLADLGLYRFFSGMTSGAVIPLSYAYIGDKIPYAERQSVLGRFIAGTLLGITFGPLLGGLFSDSLGWRASFIVPAVAFALISVAMVPLIKSEAHPSAASRSNPLRNYLALLRSPSARFICLVVAIEGGLFFGAFGFLGAFLRDEFHLSYTRIGVLLTGFGLGSVFYSIAVPLLLKHLGPARMVLSGGGLMCLAFVAIAMLQHWSLALPAILVLGFAFYSLHNTLQTLATELSPSARGSGISAFAFCLFFGQAIGVLAIAWLAQWFGYRTVFAMTGICLFILSICFAQRLPHLLKEPR